MKHPFFSWTSLLAKLFLYVAPVLVVRCSSPNDGTRESTKSGKIQISVDESFRPVIDSQ